MVSLIDLAEATRRARRIRLVLSDVDGVLTDGTVYYGVQGEMMVRFSRRDGMGVELLRDAGIETGLLTREDSPIVQRRADKLGISRCLMGKRDKPSVLSQLIEEGFDPGVIAYIGDDVNDLGVLRALLEVGLTAAPCDAVDAVQRIAHFRCKTRGGYGAFREFADWILQLRNEEART